MTSVAEARRREPLPETHSGPQPSPEKRAELPRSAALDSQHDAMLRAFAQKSGATASGSNEEHRPGVHYELYGGGAALFLSHANEANAIAMSDVHQGEIEDCYFMSTVAGLANTPKGRALIEHMMTPLANGNVSVAFPSGGTVEVDPRQLANGGAHFGGGDDNGLLPGRTEQWPAVLEAGYAKMHAANAITAGSATLGQYVEAGRIRADDPRLLEAGYRMIGNRGLPEASMRSFGLTDITATPKAAGWSAERTIRAAQDAGKLTILETLPQANPGPGDLRGDHAYTVLGVEAAGVRVRDPIDGSESVVPFRELESVAKRVTAGSIP